MESNAFKILVVDDEEDLCEILQFNLEGSGYDVDVAYSAEEALKKDLTRYHLFLLDVMMGSMSGFKLAEVMRKEMKLTTPFIFITAKNTENDLLTGFSIGSDDYIKKPFSIKEVLVRVNAVLLRVRGNSGSDGSYLVFEFEDMKLDEERKKLLINKEEVELTRKEFEILLMLVKHPDRYFLRKDILDRVWGKEIIVSERTVDVHVTRVRKKLGKYGKHLTGRSGYGYGMNFNN